MKFIGIYSAFVLVLGLVCWNLVVGSVYRDAIRTVCETVSKKLYKDDFDLSGWTKECLELRDQVSAFQDKSIVIQLMQDQLALLGYSHLGIYIPSETKALWTGVAKDTGLVGRFVEGQFIIFEVIADSPAGRRGVRPGDSLAAINGKSVTSVSQAHLLAGEYTFLRDGDVIKVTLTPEEVQVDDKPKIVQLSSSLGLLRITGFRKELFESADWKAFARAEMASYRSLIIDLRGNPGGSFVAMLRALSVFKCEPGSVGYIVKPREMMSHGNVLQALPDDSDDMVQVEFFSEYPMVNLQTFEGYPCYSGPLVVLIDEDTASVAEIFAEAVQEMGRAKVVGRTSAGDVLLGVWYDFSILGRGYSFSVPEALYQNLKGETLENNGASPDRELDYLLRDALDGKDTFVLKAQQLLL